VAGINIDEAQSYAEILKIDFDLARANHIRELALKESVGFYIQSAREEAEGGNLNGVNDYLDRAKMSAQELGIRFDQKSAQKIRVRAKSKYQIDEEELFKKAEKAVRDCRTYTIDQNLWEVERFSKQSGMKFNEKRAQRIRNLNDKIRCP
jgi:hypothetical protein